jgi:predicted DNA-binding transcriptional regulator YafY
LESFETEEIFKKLERIIKAKEYLKLTFKANNKTVDNLKALKLVWVDNNWYIAYVDENSALRLSRLSFLKSIDYGSNSRSFQSSSVKRQERFLKEELQNSLTLYDKEKKIATIKATPEVSKYFKKGMKTFLSSQKFKEELEDGSVIFTLTYTQDLEILRLIQSWMPDLVILEPTELINSYRQKLKKILEIL